VPPSFIKSSSVSAGVSANAVSPVIATTSTNPILLRKHNDTNVIKTMEDWWLEIKHNSRRDQLSFDYVAWKNNFKIQYIPGDNRNNQYFVLGRHKKKKS